MRKHQLNFKLKPNAMRKIILFLGVFLLGFSFTFAQKTISGKVTNKDDGSALPGVTVAVKGTTTATFTDVSGIYKLSVPATATTLTFSFVGMTTQEIEIGTKTTIDIILESSATNLEGVVVTALGITRDKQSLGYATQEVKGDLVSTVKTDNFTNALSGKISGIQVKKTTNMGGSTNIVLRGSKSLTGNNQVLFVIDGVPVNNDVTNTSSQKQAGLGYDYGNAASDINPDDIESINVLKGAAATALYGSRAANGVIMITTKKGSASTSTVKKGLGVTINSGVTLGFVDKSTFPEYQTSYGAGYGHYYDGDPGDEFWYLRDINGIDENGDLNFDDDQCVVTSEDASYGAPFDGHLVYQWDAFDPELANYMTATPWITAENGPITFFEKPVTLTNSVSLENANDMGSYRFSYTNYKQKGLLPNSELKKDNLLLNTTWKVSDKLSATGSASYIRTKGLGRNSTGYSDNIMTSFRQWMQTNVDIKDQWDAYDLTGRNLTWNWADPTDLVPIYWDNYYWTRYENYESDGRNRFIGNVSLDYIVNDWFDILGRVSCDSYNEIQEERRAVGSIAAPFGIGSGPDGSLSRSDQGSGYLRKDIRFSEYNYDLMANFNKDLNESFNLKGTLGTNILRTNYDRIINSTNGGLVVPEIYSLQNSVSSIPFSKELASKTGVDGIYASASLGYKSFWFIDATMRRDHSSTLPVDNSVYYYPSVSTSFIFSEFTKSLEWLSFGKIRINYAEVGASPSFDQLSDNYIIVTPFNYPITSVSGTKKNPALLPEQTKSMEEGIEMYFFKRKIGFDLAFYNTRSINQIIPLVVSTATGYNSKVVNAGEIQNKGVELSLMLNPVKTKNFKWTLIFNWAKNTNEVVELMEGVENLQLGSYQGGITINAMVGQPYGVIYGTDYIDTAGVACGVSGLDPVISSTTGFYQKTATSDNIIGNVNPDWTGGVLNSFTYKNLSFSFLIDMQKGGDMFSLDMYYGLATGLYPETDFINDKGNPVRNLVADGGGVLFEGVNPDGSVNQTYAAASNYGTFGYRRNPDAAFVYDASYVKLREIAISYSLPTTMFEKCFFSGATFSLVGSNVWIIHKNLPYADPESGLGAGNLQGYSIGSLPSTRDFGFNIKLTF